MLQNTPHQFETLSSQHKALALLRVLFRCPAYSSNELLLSDWLSVIGLTGSSPELKQVLRKLEDDGLLATKDVEGVLVVVLSGEGAEVAEGRVVVDGVLRPSPECPY